MRIEREVMMSGVCYKCSLDLAWKAATGCESPGELYVMMGGHPVKEADAIHMAALQEARKANQLNEAAVAGLTAILREVQRALGDEHGKLKLNEIPGAVRALTAEAA